MPSRLARRIRCVLRNGASAMTEELGRLIVLEGADGAGKSVLAKRVVEQLQRRGIDVEGYSFPGWKAGTLGRHIYELHQDPSRFGVQCITPDTLQLLHV